MSPRTLLHVFSTFAVGGPQVRFATLANRFGGDYRHLVIAMDGGTGCIELLRNDLDLRLLEAPPRNQTLPSRVAAYRRLLAAHHPDLLVTSNWGSIEWALADFDGTVPHLHLEDGFNPDEAQRQHVRRILGAPVSC